MDPQGIDKEIADYSKVAEQRFEAFIARGRQAMATALGKQPFRAVPSFEDLLVMGETMLRHLMTDHPDNVGVQVESALKQTAQVVEQDAASIAAAVGGVVDKVVAVVEQAAGEVRTGLASGGSGLQQVGEAPAQGYQTAQPKSEEEENRAAALQQAAGQSQNAQTQLQDGQGKPPGSDKA